MNAPFRPFVDFSTKPNRQYESIAKFRSGPYSVRVWRTATSVENAMGHGHMAFGTGWSMNELAEKIAEHPSVAAVEVTEDNGCGIIIYPDWK